MLKINEQLKDNKLYIILSGKFDEDWDYKILLNTIINNKNYIIILDLKEVEKITSYGVKQWIEFQKQLPENIKIYYQRCSIPFVDQANMISNFIIKGKIISFYAPYICEKGHEYQQLLTTKELKKNSDGEYEMIYKKCEICGAKAELDDFPSDYFLFNE